MKKKIDSYLGFAKKSGNLMSGINTCSFGLSRGKVKLVILAEDISENSEKKMMKEAKSFHISWESRAEAYLPYVTIILRKLFWMR